MPRLSIYWILCAVWAAKIFFLSTDAFSSEATRPFLARLLEQLHIELAPAAFSVLHTLVRKTAHVFEYAVLTCLLYRAILNRARPAWSPRAARWCVAAVAVWSLSDEFHQWFSNKRGASLADCAIDLAGAMLALFLIRSYTSRDSLSGQPPARLAGTATALREMQ